MTKKIIFIAQYATGSEHYKRLVSPAACAKVSSILATLGRLKISTCLCSIAKTSHVGKIEQEIQTISPFVSCHFIAHKNSANKLLKFCYRLQYYFTFTCYILREAKTNDYLWLYHTYFIGWLFIVIAKIKHLNLILEVEEIYGDVNGNPWRKWWELQLFKFANAYIFPTQQLNRLINTRHKPVAIIEGTYHVETLKAVPAQDGFVHVVYAGTLDPRKGGALAAVTAAGYLLPNYHVHILGFGSKEQIKYLENQIQQVQQKTTCPITFEGLKTGEEYICFLQRCHIGLSTQNPDAQFNATSFPSKILSYLANGLHVVSIRIPVIEESAVFDLLTCYDKQTPQEIAKAIMAVDLKTPYNSRTRLQQLDKKFQEDLQKVLDQFSHETFN